MGYINSQIGETSQTMSESEKMGPPGPGGPPGPEGPPGRRVTKAQRDQKVLMDRGVKKVPRDHKDIRVQKVTKVILGLRVVPAVRLILICKISTIFCD